MFYKYVFDCCVRHIAFPDSFYRVSDFFEIRVLGFVFDLLFFLLFGQRFKSLMPMPPVTISFDYHITNTDIDKKRLFDFDLGFKDYSKFFQDYPKLSLKIARLIFLIGKTTFKQAFLVGVYVFKRTFSHFLALFRRSFCSSICNCCRRMDFFIINILVQAYAKLTNSIFDFPQGKIELISAPFCPINRVVLSEKIIFILCPLVSNIAIATYGIVGLAGIFSAFYAHNWNLGWTTIFALFYFSLFYFPAIAKIVTSAAFSTQCRFAFRTASNAFHYFFLSDNLLSIGVIISCFCILNKY